MINNTPINALIKQYEAEECDFSNLDWVIRVSKMYVERMPDSQVRCLLHTLANAATPDNATQHVK